MVPMEYSINMKKKPEKRVRLSMKLLWKLHEKWVRKVLEEDGSLGFVATPDFLNFLEKELRSSKETI